MLSKFYKRLLIAICCLSSSLIAQSQEIIQSPTFKMSSKYSTYNIMGENDFGILVHYSNTTDHLIEIYNQNLKPLFKRELVLPNKRDIIEEVILFKDHLGVLYSNYDGRSMFLNYTQLNSKLTPTGNGIVLDSVKLNAIDINPKYYIKTSEDKSKIIVFYFTYRGNNWMFTYKLFDSEFNLIGQGNILNEEKGSKTPRSVRVSNSGNVFCALAHSNNRYDSENAHNIDNLSIYTRALGASFFTKKEIGKEHYLLKGINTRIDEKTESIYLFGGYIDKQNNSNIGLFTSVFDFGEEFVQEFNEIPFNSESVSLGTGTTLRNWEDKAMIIEPRRIVIRSDGGVILVTESEYKYVEVVKSPISNFNPYGMSNYYTSYYDKNYFYDIWVTSINPDGTVEWVKSIRKSQETQTDDGMYSSFSFFEANNALKFLFNEDIYSNGNFVEFDINPNGNTKRLSLFNSQKLNTILIPNLGKQISNNRIIIPGEQKKNIQFIMLKY